MSSLVPSFTFILIIIGIFSFISLFYLSYNSTSGFSKLTKTDPVSRSMEEYIEKLENEVNLLESTIKLPNSVQALDFSDSQKVDVTTKQTGKLFEGKESDSSIAESENTGRSVGFVDEKSEIWKQQLSHKLKCLRLKQGGLYLYHIRKAAGTSIRDVMHMMALQWRVPFLETEGVILDQSILNHKGLTSVITLRDPINRILSLYWYEHVGWFDGVLKQTQKCKPLSEWVNAWRDGSAWKTKFIEANPGTVYVEIENYYTKALIGWKDPSHKINEEDFQRAKEVLSRFDLVFLTDWMGDDTQVDALNSVFPGRSNVALGHKIRGDYNAKVRLSPTLAPDEAQVREELTRINAFDLRLFDYAQSLMAYRLKLITPIVNEVKRDLGLNAHRNTVNAKQLKEAQASGVCGDTEHTLTVGQKKSVGIFRPPGHKGPL